MEASLNGPLGQTALGQGVLKIGRAPDNLLVISDPQSSAHHAEIAPGFGASSYQITDLNSTNGTFVNDQRLTPNTPRTLNSGDSIRIGSLRFTYEASDAQAPAVASAFNSDQTIADQAPGASPTVYSQPPAFSNYSAPPQPFVAPPPAPPRMDYPAAQPGYPQSGGFNQASYPPISGLSQTNYPQPKKSRVGLWIGLIILLLLIVGGGIGGYMYLQNRSTPEKTLQALCTALQNNDSQGYYNTLSSGEQAKTDLNKISTGFQLTKLLLGGFSSCTYSNVQASGSNATATLTLTPMRGKVFSGPIQLLEENGTWKIASKTGLPGL